MTDESRVEIVFSRRNKGDGSPPLVVFEAAPSTAEGKWYAVGEGVAICYRAGARKTLIVPLAVLVLRAARELAPSPLDDCAALEKVIERLLASSHPEALLECHCRPIVDEMGGDAWDGELEHFVPPVEIGVAGSCDLRCAYCHPTAPDPVAPLEEEWRRLCEELMRHRRLGEVRIEWRARAGFDHEPTSFPRLAEAMAYARRIGIKHQTLVTNGFRTGERAFLESLHDSGLDGVSITFSGFGAATGEDLYGVAGVHQARLNTLEGARWLGMEVKTSVLLIAPALGDLDGIIESIVPRLPEAPGRPAIRLILAESTLPETGRFVPPLDDSLAALRATLPRYKNERFVLKSLPLCLKPELAPLENLRFVRSSDGEYAAVCASCGLRDRCPGLPLGYLGLHGDRVCRPAT